MMPPGRSEGPTPPAGPAAPIYPARRRSPILRVIRLVGLYLVIALAAAVLGVVLVMASTHFLPPVTIRRLVTPAMPSIPQGWQIAIAALSLHVVCWSFTCGYLLAGRLVGFRFRWLVLGPLRIYRAGTRVRVAPNKNLSLWFGRAFSLPRTVGRLRARLAFRDAGGPLTSLFIALGCLSGWLVGAQLALQWPPTVAWMLYFTGLLALSSAILNVIPYSSGNFSSAGVGLWRMARGGPRAERTIATVAVFALQDAGVRPRDWNMGMLVRSATLHDESPAERIINTALYVAALDRHDYDTASAALDRTVVLLPEAPQSARSALLREAAYFNARYRHAAAWSRTAFDSAGQDTRTDRSDSLRAEAAIAWAEGRGDDARTLAQQALAALAQRKSPLAGALAFDRDQLQSLLQEIESAQVANVVEQRPTEAAD